jgi:hypothetical protein
MQASNGNAGFTDWGHLRRRLLSLWKEALIVAALAALGASAAAFTEIRENVSEAVPDVMDNICRGSAAP